MSLIERISLELSNELGNRLNKTDEEKAVLNYGLFMVIHTAIAIVLTFMVGIVTNTLITIMFISISSSLLKRYSGGVHSSTPNRCILTGAIVLTFMVGIVTNTLITIMFISISSSLLKRYSGGVHSSTPNRCILTGIILTLLLANICKYSVEYINSKILGILIVFTIIVVYYIIYKKCPVPSKNKPFKKDSTRKKIRKKAFNLLNIYSIFIQIFAMTNIGEKFITKFEVFYDLLKIK